MVTEKPTERESLTPEDIERTHQIPRSTQKKARAAGRFAPHYVIGRRVYYRRSSFEAWLVAQEGRAASGGPDAGPQTGAEGIEVQESQ